MKLALVAAALAAATGCAAPRVAELAPPPAGKAVAGNEARILVDGPATHRAMFEAMDKARDHVNLQTYILEEGEIAERLAALLEKKAQQGVRVQVLYDAVGSLKTPKEYFERLRSAGVKVCAINPVAKVESLNNRDHRKILVVDGRIAFTGGVNISQAYSSGSLAARRNPGPDKNGWRDTQVEVRGPAVQDFQRIFLDAWALQDCGPFAKAAYYPQLPPQGGKTVRVLKTDPEKGSEMYRELLKALGGAKQRVWITMGYFVPDPRTKEALVAAAKRGVDVRIILPGYSDFWAPVAAGRSHYASLLEAGVKIYEWREALMHAKTAVIDSHWSSVGSTNLDWRSLVHNYEADLIVLDAGFAGEMERLYQRDIKAAVAIEMDQWEKRGMVQRVKEFVARQWEYML